ncbi:MAG: hypothetical protein OXU45_09845 [Candidatus Melainabacteria bacterium]|nr:hypothetical protein [Candidatus Melainabacteria bacterium]
MNFQEIVSSAIKETVKGSHDPDINVSIALYPLDKEPLIYHHYEQQDQRYHPASLIKLFHAYIAKYKIQSNAADFALEKIKDPESFASANHMDDVYAAIDAALRESDNDALSYLMDYNSGVSSGPRLDEAGLEVFKNARHQISEFFHERGYSKQLNLPGKCFSFAPYGREKQLSLEEEGLGRNAILIQDVVQIMMALRADFPELFVSIKRELEDDSDIQTQFIARGLREDKDQIKEYFSKAGWTSMVRHDAALIKTNDNKEIIMVIMTKNLSQFEDLIPCLANSCFSVIATAS